MREKEPMQSYRLGLVVWDTDPQNMMWGFKRDSAEDEMGVCLCSKQDQLHP